MKCCEWRHFIWGLQYTNFAYKTGYQASYSSKNGLIEHTFKRKGSFYCACILMRNAHFALLNNQKDRICGHVRKFVTLSIIFWTIFIRFGSKLYRQIVGIPMGINCARLVADLFLFSYERLHVDQVDTVETFNSTSRYLDDLLNIIPISNKW